MCVKESIYIQTLLPSVNCDGGIFNLARVWIETVASDISRPRLLKMPFHHKLCREQDYSFDEKLSDLVDFYVIGFNRHYRKVKQYCK